MPNDATPSDHAAPPDPGSPPEPADWWVWGVRKVAGVVAEIIMTLLPLLVPVIVFKAVMWALTNDRSELVHLGIAVAAIPLLWGLRLLLGRFSAERDGPDPERWLAHRQRQK